MVNNGSITVEGNECWSHIDIMACHGIDSPLPLSASLAPTPRGGARFGWNDVELNTIERSADHVDAGAMSSGEHNAVVLGRLLLEVFREFLGGGLQAKGWPWPAVEFLLDSA